MDIGLATSTFCVDHDAAAGWYAGACLRGLVLTNRTSVIFSLLEGRSGWAANLLAGAAAVVQRKSRRFMSYAPCV
jgi:hypothetical protein